VSRLCDLEKLKSRPEGGDSGSKKCKRGYGDAYVMVWLKSVFGGSLASVTVKMFAHLINFLKKFL
jgi:hypothetical protein